MKTILRLLAVTLAVLFAATAAQATDEPRPDKSTAAESVFYVTTTFRHVTPPLAPNEIAEATWTAHFEDGDRYVLAGTIGRHPESDGSLVATTDVADLVYWDPGKSLEWVRVCVRPRGSNIFTEPIGTDGHPLCDNVETGGYRNGYPDGDPYRATTHALDVAQTVAAVKANAKTARAR